ncbi:type IV secretory system conjugative DNA transfer family protein [Herbiconiux sp. VKM Ac-2851]|uniref:type IV secretory system conjugative DNA transfer family protein n=1 Tax=Herbiconiux sp. VKM Ac-2851 TaxID=2739025 RepID=UPI001566BED0|nr:type IV secretory system conjugative DNA transfer family protein [Herbiconiux sp. VKM Ac-2851]NQX37107.1 TraM recognition domain-containing protein [Herbiconiux sp. VKM Ac-2851]
MSTSNRRRAPGLEGSTILLLVGLTLAVLVLGTVWAAVTWGSKLDGVNPDLSGDPFELFFGVLRGKVTWPGSATWIAVAAAAVIVALGILLWVAIARSRSKWTRVDEAARFMGKGKDLASLSAKNARATAQRLGVDGWIGVTIGVTIVGKQKLYASAEDMIVMVAGPRVGKSTSYVIPAIVDAPGAVVTTSNKRDVVDATRDVRAADGSTVWVFDPQGIAREEPTWWWNPLSYVTDDTRAARLAAHFASSTMTGGASENSSYFNRAGENLLAGFLLAAALDGRPITQIFTWTTRPGEIEPVKILERHGFIGMADAVAGEVNGEPKRRDSVYGTAARMVDCLKIGKIARWVTALGGDSAADPRPQFSPEAFVRSRDTLYSLSMEGQGSAGPLVTALTAITVEAAEELATTQRGGRLSVPMLGVLDEAANVCRWRNLPDLYSHYGSRGIVLMTILQSWSQGVEVWGREGMRKLWSASNVKVYGGGVAETEFLGELSQLVGDYDKHTSSTSVGQGHRSTSHEIHRERTLDVSELSGMPRGRAVVFASGAPATLIETVPWMRGPHADSVRASIAAHDPAGAGVAATPTPVDQAVQAWVEAGTARDGERDD